MKKERMKKKILKVARELISRYGFKKTTMRDIARALNVGKATLYYYFRSKEEILKEIIEEEGQKLRQVIEEAVNKEKSAKEKLRKYALARFRFLRELGLYYQAVRKEIYRHLDFIEKERKKFDKFDLEILKSILYLGIGQGEFKEMDVDYYAYLLLQGVKGLEYPVIFGEAFKIPGEKEENPERAVNTFVDIVLYGLCKQNS